MYPFKPRLFFEPALSLFEECLWRPAVDVRRTRYGWLVKVELPGVHLDDVRLEVRGNSVILSGVRKDTVLEEGETTYVMEMSYCRFERRIELPATIERARVRPSCKDGLLLLRLETAGGEEGS
jgi:HSP20 family protein